MKIRFTHWRLPNGTVIKPSYTVQKDDEVTERHVGEHEAPRLRIAKNIKGRMCPQYERA